MEVFEAYMLHWTQQGKQEKAEALLESSLEGRTCDMENSLLFIRAISFYKALGNDEKAEHYERMFKKFEDDLGNHSSDYNSGWQDDLYFNSQAAFDYDYGYEKQKPVVKPAKVYPNDPCPCGSGKKYKKCCAKG